MSTLKIKNGTVWEQIVAIKGEKGEKGDAGDALPAGGVAGQLLIKNSATDNDATWQNNPSAPLSHGHSIGDVTNLQTTLDGKSSTSHLHDDRYYTEAEVNAAFAPKANPTFTGTIIGENTQLSGHLVGTGNALLEGRFGGVARGYIWNDTAGIAILNNTGTAVLRAPIGSNDISIPHRLDLTGGQIKFPATQNASADPNTLDDYEEGAWTPTTTTPNLTIVIQDTSYTKIGNMVFAKCYLEINNTSGSIINTYKISGLPFISLGYGFATSYFQGTQVSRYIETYGNFVDWIQDLAVGSNLRMYQFVYNTL